jgi:hypothetical protein
VLVDSQTRLKAEKAVARDFGVNWFLVGLTGLTGVLLVVVVAGGGEERHQPHQTATIYRQGGATHS